MNNEKLPFLSRDVGLEIDKWKINNPDKALLEFLAETSQRTNDLTQCYYYYTCGPENKNDKTLKLISAFLFGWRVEPDRTCANKFDATRIWGGITGILKR